MIDVIAGIAMDKVGLARHGRVHVTVENQAVAAPGPRKRSQHVEPVAEQTDPARSKPFALEPLIDVLGDVRL